MEFYHQKGMEIQHQVGMKIFTGCVCKFVTNEGLGNPASIGHANSSPQGFVKFATHQTEALIGTFSPHCHHPPTQVEAVLPVNLLLNPPIPPP